MSMKGFVSGLVFWTMALIGGAALAPCLILPAWLEYKSACAERASYERLLTNLEDRRVRLERQIDHQKNDPAYNERQLRVELGRTPPGVETVLIKPQPPDADAAEDTAEESVRPGMTGQELVQPEVAAFLEDALRRYPFMQLYLHDQIRPVLMIFGGGMLLTAIVLLGRSVGRRPEPRPWRAADPVA